MRQAGFGAVPEVDPRPLLSTIRRRLHESETVPAGRRWLRQLGMFFAPMAAATAALAVLLVIRKGPPEHPGGSPPTAGAPGTDVVRAKGGLGPGAFGPHSFFDIELRIGAGAYVCGEETALLESLEGKRGVVRAKPPLPAHKGLFGKPTATVGGWCCLGGQFAGLFVAKLWF